jgi:hypothetical protein
LQCPVTGIRHSASLHHRQLKEVGQLAYCRGYLIAPYSRWLFQTSKAIRLRPEHDIPGFGSEHPLKSGDFGATTMVASDGGPQDEFELAGSMETCSSKGFFFPQLSLSLHT